MYLLLTNGDRVLVHNKNCAFERLEVRPGVYRRREWDISPYHWLRRGIEGHFVIAKYGTLSDAPCFTIISTKHVVGISDADNWEYDKVEEDARRKMEVMRKALF